MADLKESGKRFAVATNKEHRRQFEKILPEGTVYLEDPKPNLRRFFNDASLRGLDVAVVDEEGIGGVDPAASGLFAYAQDARDGRGDVLIVVFSRENVKPKNTYRAFERYYGAGIYNVASNLDKRTVSQIIADAIESPATQASVEARKPKAGLFARMRKEPDSQVFEPEADKDVRARARAFAEGVESERELARKALEDSGKLPRLPIPADGYHDDTEAGIDTAQIPSTEPAVSVLEPVAPVVEAPLDPAQDDSGPGDVLQAEYIERADEPQADPGAGIVPADLAAAMERMRAQLSADFEQRERAMREEYESLIASAVRGGRAQRTVAVCSLADAMTAEAAQEIATMSHNYFGKLKVRSVEHDAGKLEALEAYGFHGPGDKGLLAADVLVHDFGTDVAAAAASGADAVFLVLQPTPWTVEDQRAAYESAKGSLEGLNLVVCVPAKGPRMGNVAQAILGDGFSPVFGPNPNHYALKAVVNPDFGPAVAEVLRPAALEVDPGFKEKPGYSGRQPQGGQGKVVESNVDEEKGKGASNGAV